MDEPVYVGGQTREWVEVEGGTFCGGRHVRGKAYARDCEKYNAAVALGWRVFRLTGDMLRDDPMGTLASILDVIQEVET